MSFLSSGLEIFYCYQSPRVVTRWCLYRASPGSILYRASPGSIYDYKVVLKSLVYSKYFKVLIWSKLRTIALIKITLPSPWICFTIVTASPQVLHLITIFKMSLYPPHLLLLRVFLKRQLQELVAVNGKTFKKFFLHSFWDVCCISSDDASVFGMYGRCHCFGNGDIISPLSLRQSSPPVQSSVTPETTRPKDLGYQLWIKLLSSLFVVII